VVPKAQPEQVIASSSDSETETSVEEQPESMQELVGDVIHAMVQQRFAAIRTVVGLEYLSPLPETPSAAQQEVLGGNLIAFRDAQYTNPTASLANPVIGNPSANLVSFTNQRRYRTLHARVVRIKGSNNARRLKVANYKGEPTAPNHEYHVLDLPANQYDTQAATEIAGYLRDILERVPTFLRLLSVSQRVWAERAAIRLAFDNNPNLKLCLPHPRYNSSGNFGVKNRSYRIQANGYDPSKNDAWQERLWVPIGQLRLNRPIQVPSEPRITWTETRGNIPATDREKLTDADFAQAYRVAQAVAVRSYGFVGSWVACWNEAVQTIQDQWESSASTDRLPKQKLTSGDVNWTGEDFIRIVKTGGNNTTILPEAILSDNMVGRTHSIVVDSTSREKIFPVVNSMLEALKAKHDCDIVWGVGCHRADLENKALDQEEPISSYYDQQDAVQRRICPECLRMKPYEEFDQVLEYRYYHICTDCIAVFDKGTTDPLIKGKAFGYHLLEYLKEENEHSGANLKERELKVIQQEIYEYLMSRHNIKGSIFKDGYCQQNLDYDDQTKRRQAWDKQKVNGLLPSIEAGLPVVKGGNGKTAYHVKENMLVTSDSINRGKRHYPPILLHGVLMFQLAVQSSDQKLWESAVTLFRMYLVNHYAYGDLGHVQQNKRRGKTFPSNIDQIIRSFTTPLLLKAEAPPDKIYRFLSTRQRVPVHQRLTWKHPKQDWLYDQLGKAAEAVFGAHNVQRFRYLFIRLASTGDEVFFPFSVKYSVVQDFTQWDLFELLSVRKLRNIAHCQAPHARTKPPIQYSVEELFLVIANLWLRMIKADYDAGVPLWACGRDEAGLMLVPSINDLQCASLGHRIPGEAESIGLRNFDMSSSAPVLFEAKDCLMVWESQFCNLLKFKYPIESLEDEIFPQLALIRLANQMITDPLLLPTQPLELTLDQVPDPFAGKPPAGTLITDTDSTRRFDAQTAGILRDVVVQHTRKHASTKTSQAVGDILAPGSPAHDKTGPQDANSDLVLAAAVEDDDALFHFAIEESLRDTSKNSNATPYLGRRNMRNLGATCYASCILQLFSNIGSLRSIITHGYDIKVPTGRSPLILEKAEDPDGVKHMVIYRTLSTLCRRLQSGNERLAIEECREPLAAFQALSTTFQNQVEEAAFLWSWLVDTLIVTTDRSKAINKDDIWLTRANGTAYRRHRWSPEEEINNAYTDAATNSHPVESLAHHVHKHMEAHLDSGHRSPLALLTTIQYVDLSECNDDSCGLVLRDIGYLNSMMLQISRATHEKDGVISFEDLINANFSTHFTCGGASEQTADWARDCINKKHQEEGESAGQYGRVVRRITSAPPVFMVEINRASNVASLGEIGGWDEAAIQVALAETPHMQRLGDYTHIHMSNWSNEGPRIRTGHERLSGDNLNARYDAVAIVAYSHVGKHYASFIKIDHDWVWFNDLDPRPAFKDPFNDWPEDFVESMICYQVVSKSAARQPVPSPSLLSESVVIAQLPALESDGPGELTLLREENAELRERLQAKDEQQASFGLYPELQAADRDSISTLKTLNQIKSWLTTRPRPEAERLLENLNDWFQGQGTFQTVPSDDKEPDEPQRTPRRLLRRASQGFDKVMDAALGRKHDQSGPKTPENDRKRRKQDTPQRQPEGPRGAGGLINEMKDAAYQARRKSGNWLEKISGVRGKTKTPEPVSNPHESADKPQSSPVSPSKVVSKAPTVRGDQKLQSSKFTKRTLPQGQLPEAKRSKTSLQDPKDPADIMDASKDIVIGRPPSDPFGSRQATGPHPARPVATRSAQHLPATGQSPYLAQGVSEPGSRSAGKLLASSSIYPQQGQSQSARRSTTTIPSHVQEGPANRSTVSLPRSQGQKNLAEIATAAISSAGTAEAPSIRPRGGLASVFTRRPKRRLVEEDDDDVEDDEDDSQSKNSKRSDKDKAKDDGGRWGRRGARK